MGNYIVNFAVYTLAMSGLIFLAVFIYKKVMTGGYYSSHTSSLEIEETMNISPRKTLMIVRAGEERFLVASDLDRTSLISKLNSNEIKSSSQETDMKDEISKNLDILIQEKNFDNQKFQDITPENKPETVHLELIKNEDKKATRKKKRMPVSEQNSKINSKTKSRLDTMKEMAKKINEI